MVELMATSSKRAYAVPRPAAPRAPVPVAVHCWPVSTGDDQTQFCLSLCGVSGSWCTQGLFESFEHLWRVWGLILNAILLLLPSFLGFSFALGPEVSFFGGIQHSPVDGFSPVSCNFGVLTGEDEHTSFYSSILQVICTDLSNQHQILLHSLRRQMGTRGHCCKVLPLK